MDRLGEELDTFRRESDESDGRSDLRPSTTSCTTRLYRTTTSLRLREIHVEIDEAVREAYALDEEREPAIREYESQRCVRAVAGVAGD